MERTLPRFSIAPARSEPPSTYRRAFTETAGTPWSGTGSAGPGCQRPWAGSKISTLSSVRRPPGQHFAT